MAVPVLTSCKGAGVKEGLGGAGWVRSAVAVAHAMLRIHSATGGGSTCTSPTVAGTGFMFFSSVFLVSFSLEQPC